jgi:hypothetical protein
MDASGCPAGLIAGFIWHPVSGLIPDLTYWIVGRIPDTKNSRIYGNLGDKNTGKF